MNENEMVEQLKSEGFDKVWMYNAVPNEVDEEHQHDFDTRLIILNGDIQITQELSGVVTNTKYLPGQVVEIPRHTLHAAVVGGEGCRYIVAEKY